MNIDRVRVQGLFDDFEHDLAFGTDERIMIVTGPNGFGKTTTLKLINVLFNQSLGRLASMPFREVDVSFDEGTHLIATRNVAEEHRDGDRLPLTLTLERGSERETFCPPNVVADSNDLRIPIGAIEDAIPALTRIGPRKWHDAESGSTLDLQEVLAVFGDELPPDALRDSSPIPEWLQDIKNCIAVRLIDTERLTRTYRGRRRAATGFSLTRTVSHYSKELARRIVHSIAKYGELSQSLDRTFPARLVTDRLHSGKSAETLLEELAAIDQKRSQLEEAGLLAGDQPGIVFPIVSSVAESQLAVLSVYAEDARAKLGVFDDLYAKVSTFQRIVNSRFRHKQVAVNAKGVRVFKDDGTTLDLEKLSSGEQHELVMLYELLFRASSDSLILIDEPELSLHVAWQEQWVEDLEETAKLSDFRAIVATHSPEIIGDSLPYS